MSYSVSPELYRETAVRLADALDGGGYFSAVSYTHLTLPTNRVV